MANERPADPLNGLFDIVHDMWGMSGVRPPAPLAAENEEQPAAPAPAELPEAPKPDPADLWRRADSTIEWTEALASPMRPADAPCTDAQWLKLHKLAPAVLEGSLPAYLEALEAFDPLGDLTAVAGDVGVTVDSADRMSVSFTVTEDALPEDETENRRMLSGICLRCARDLLALLPLTEVAVSAVTADGRTLRVTFRRQSLRKVNFSFVDPLRLTEAAGGVFGEKI